MRETEGDASKHELRQKSHKAKYRNEIVGNCDKSLARCFSIEVFIDVVNSRKVKNEIYFSFAICYDNTRINNQNGLFLNLCKLN